MIMIERKTARNAIAVTLVRQVFVPMLVLFAMATVAPAQDRAADAPLPRGLVLQAFDEAAFGPADRPDPHLYRWPTARPVTVRMTGDAPTRFLLWTEQQIAELAALTGLQITTSNAIGADVIVAFVPDFDAVLQGRYNDLLDRFVASTSRRDNLLAGYRAAGAVCAGQVNARGSDMAEAIVFIPTNLMAPVAHACIASQLSRILGLPFALPDGSPSTLATDSPYAHLTALDRVMLQMLYHPRMRAGVTRQDAHTVALSIVSEINGPD